MLCQSRDIPGWRWALLPGAHGLLILVIVCGRFLYRSFCLRRRRYLTIYCWSLIAA